MASRASFRLVLNAVKSRQAGAAVAVTAVAGAAAWNASDSEQSRNRRLAVPLSGLMAPSPTLCDAPAKKVDFEYHAVPLPSSAHGDVKEIVSRFKTYVSGDLNEVARFKKEKDGVKIYTIKEGKIPDPTGKYGLPFARIGETEIAAPAEDVAQIWWVFNGRKDWDAQTAASEVVDEYGTSTRLVYIRGHPKPLISSRDFVFLSWKVPPGDLGGRLGSYAFVQVNSPSLVSDSSLAVRGNINSTIIVTPIDATHTRVRYVVEVEPKGWLPAVAVEAAADDLPGTLGAIKKHLEAQAAEEDERKLAERRESLRDKDHKHALLTESVTASVEDLEALQKMLKARLEQIKRDERQLGAGSLAELRTKVQADLKTVEARLKAARR